MNSNPECAPSLGAVEMKGQECYKDSGLPQDVTEGASGLNDARVLTSAVAGAASSAVFAGR